jgi:hypothetical protein
VALVVGMVACIPRVLSVGYSFNLDEWLWMQRSTAFSDAMLHGDPSRMNAVRPLPGTMPGIPTVWLGSFARLMWNLGGSAGLVDRSQPFASSASGFACAELAVAIATSVLIGLFAYLVAHWSSRVVAIAAGGVLATEPFWVTLGSILHTDELVALFGLTGSLAFAWVLAVPSGVRRPAHPRRWAIVAGALLVCSPLTKLNGLAFGPSALGILVVAGVSSIRSRDAGTGRLDACRPLLRSAALTGGAGLVTALVLYPALLTAPLAQARQIHYALHVIDGQRHVFFRGHTTGRPGPLFYPIVLAYRSTPWTFVLLPAGLAIAFARRASRPFAALAVLIGVVPGLVLLPVGLKYDRYSLVVLGPVVLAASTSLHAVASELRERWIGRLGWVGVAGALAFSTIVAPWGNLVFNPIMSAIKPPVAVMQVGWGEASAIGMPIIERDAAAHGRTCASLTVFGLGKPPLPGKTCEPRRVESRSRPDYLVLSPMFLRSWRWTLKSEASDYVLIARPRIYGQPIAEVWRRRSLSCDHGPACDR